jgi:hypothetical protein
MDDDDDMVMDERGRNQFPPWAKIGMVCAAVLCVILVMFVISEIRQRQWQQRRTVLLSQLSDQTSSQRKTLSIRIYLDQIEQRDQCCETIWSLFQTATDPYQCRVCIVTDDLFFEPYYRREWDGRGIGRFAQQLLVCPPDQPASKGYQGETYCLLCSIGLRWITGWDRLLSERLDALKDPMAMITEEPEHELFLEPQTWGSFPRLLTHTASVTDMSIEWVPLNHEPQFPVNLTVPILFCSRRMMFTRGLHHKLLDRVNSSRRGSAEGLTDEQLSLEFFTTGIKFYTVYGHLVSTATLFPPPSSQGVQPSGTLSPEQQNQWIQWLKYSIYGLTPGYTHFEWLLKMPEN